MATCPVIGTTNSVLPPNHPEVDLNVDGQTVITSPLSQNRAAN